MEKIVVKTAVKTALIIFCLLLIILAVVNFAFPQHMATFSENIGNYSLAVKYASLRYTYTGDKYDLARCVDDSILSGNDSYILEYGEKLIGDEGFFEVCEYKNTVLGSDYRQYVGGKVAVADYNLGDFDGALSLASDINGNDSFKSGNALMTLCLRVVYVQDGESAEALIRALNEVTPSDDGEIQLLAELIALLDF